MASGFVVGVCIYDKRVLDKSRQRMSLQEIGREDSRECGHVAEGAVDLLCVHASEITQEVSQSIYLNAGVKLLLE